MTKPSAYRALSLRERLQCPQSSLPIHRAKGEERLLRWNQQAPFSEEDFFARRLAVDGLNREQLRDLLGQRVPPGLALTADTAWVQTLADCFWSVREDQPRLAPPSSWSVLPAYPFWSFVEPIFRQSLYALARQVEALLSSDPAGPIRSESLLELLKTCLPHALLDWPLRTLVLELNIARLRGHLKGNDSRQRFQEFINGLQEPAEALRLLSEYPVLAAQLIQHADMWRQTTLEVLQRLHLDWTAIVETFALGTEEELAGIQISAGDQHRAGRSVAILRFRSGLRLVYKPRNLALDIAFQDLLHTVESWGFRPGFRTLQVLNRETHGWAEHVETKPCDCLPEVARFYQRQGGYLALLYALRATDIHYDNVLACGEHPVIIDLETLLQPGSIIDDPLADDPLHDSILQVGLLPLRSWENEASAGLDVSSLGGPGGQMPPRPEMFWAKQGTDEMHLTRRMRQIEPVTRHHPQLDGHFPPATEYVEEITAGFSRMYNILLARREELLSSQGPLDGFLDTEVRVILRPTSVYSLMLRESFHPDFLRDALDRDRFFDKLWKQVPKRPCLARVIAAEQRALWQRDIPLFSAHPRNRHLALPSCQQLDNFFTQSAEELVRDRLQNLGTRDHEQQLWFIRASISILSTSNPERDAAHQIASPPDSLPAISGEQLIALAMEIADALCQRTLEQGDEVRWLGLLPTRQGAFKIATLGPDLYSGQAGITFFLAYLGHLCDAPKYTEAARRSCATLLADLPGAPVVSESPGAFTGLSGILYLLYHLSTLWQEPVLLDRALELSSQLVPRVKYDQALDLVNGCAGCIAALADLARSRPDESLLGLLTDCGEHLLGQAVEQAQGLGWITSGETSVPMTGFSHGTAGIATALLELSNLTGRMDFKKAALESLRYERSLFSETHGNWPDLRQEEDRFDAVNWCHGAPGIALSRALLLRHCESSEAQDELRVAVRTTLERGFGRNHSLCHGDLGNLDCLLSADLALPELDLAPQIRQLRSTLASRIQREGWRCGLPMEVETPGLMVGLAGIGYGLLRLAVPDRSPSVLALAPPVATVSS